MDKTSHSDRTNILLSGPDSPTGKLIPGVLR